MGNYSWLVATRNGASKCTIDWTGWEFPPQITRGSEAYHLTWRMDKENGHYPQSNTVQELAESFHDTKLFGYLDNDYIIAFMELCRHMSMPEDDKSFPRIYYEEEGWNRLHYLEFHPGTDIIIWGTFSFQEKDLPDYPKKIEDSTGGEFDLTEEQIERHRAQKKAVFIDMIDNRPEQWVTRRLKPMDDANVPSLYTLMTIFGIRPEDADALERASHIIDIKKAMATSVKDLLK